MAQADNDFQNFTGLRLTTDNPPEDHLLPSAHHGKHDSDLRLVVENPRGSRPPYRGSATSQDTIRAIATPPVAIPQHGDATAIEDDPSSPTTYIEHYMRHRHASHGFDLQESEEPQLIPNPLVKPEGDRRRGRPVLKAVSDSRQFARAQSESESDHYDPNTGRHLPKYSTTPPREQARVGEGRFPLLQRTVDEMARESEVNLAHPMSLTSESTMSPLAQPVTPRDDESALLSPAVVSPLGSQGFSHEESRPFRRTASQRWKDGEYSASPQDFFARAGSLRNRSLRDMAGRSSRQDTMGSTKSPRSTASSYLRSFSISSGGNGDGSDGGPPAVDAEGQTIGDDYVVGKQIGFGGFSTIKEVTQLKDGQHRKLAVKIVRRRIDGKSEPENDQAQAEFEHEVELWRFLDHSNILPLEAVYKLDEATFCFIPLNIGGTLFDLVRSHRNGLPMHVAKSYGYQLAVALSYLHYDARVAHRDIKLENCLVESAQDGQPGRLRVCDFGMAEWLSNDSGSGPPSPSLHDSDRPPQKHIGPADTSTSAFAGGSLEYAAPEILRIAARTEDDERPVERSIVSAAVDVWAYGVCVYSMVVGSRPFQDAFQPRVVMAILSGDWDRNKLRERGGDDVYEVVNGCLEMNVADRWTISQVIDSAWLEDLATEDDSQHNDNSIWRL